eukprot:3563979-Amphidinium_carterae.3
MVVHVTEIVESTHRDRSLLVNYSAGKTEAAIHIAGPEAKALFQGLRMVGKSKGCAGTAGPALLTPNDHYLAICRDYIHLGKVHEKKCCPKREIATRVAKAIAAFKSRG